MTGRANRVEGGAGGHSTAAGLDMRVEVLSLTDDTVRFILEGVDVAFANALRRTMIAEVPCMAIDDIFIFDNSSVIPDEVLAQRIGFIPLKTDLDSYILPEECECGSDLGCSLCRLVLTLDVKAEIGTRTVYSGDFASEDPNVVPVSSEIPLTKLAPGQAVRLEAYAQLGLGKVHAKWQPVSEAIYQHVAEVEVDEERCTACGECVEVCPCDVLSVDDGKLKVVNVYGCTLCGECMKACPVEPAAVTQGNKADAFLFSVESTGCLPPERIVSEAARVLIANLDEFSTKIRRGETDDEITDFELGEQETRRLYSVGARDFEDEEDEMNDEP
jgi:DNA-directed RNA polymerase subunit D